MDSLPPSLRHSKDRHLLVAYRNVMTHWMPPNPAVIEHIRRGFEEGRYDLDPLFLIEEIRTDIGLVTWCIRQICAQIESGAMPPPPLTDPLDILRYAGLPRIRQLLSPQLTKEISKHTLSEAQSFQGGALRDSLITATVAETLCEPLQIDPKLGFSVGLLRHLGMALVAWNYPNVFRRALGAAQEGANFETAFTSAAGFSPQLLGQSIIESWPVSEEIRLALDPIGVHAGSRRQSAMRDHLRSICDVGEALARAMDPERDRSRSARDWDFAQQALQQRLGNGSLQLVREKIESNLSAYIEVDRRIFKPTFAVRGESPTERAIEKHPENQFIKFCPKPVRDELQLLYNDLDPATVSKENIRRLIRNIIPLAGFKSGCIYLFDPISSQLVPHLRIGTDSQTKLQPIPATPSATTANPISVAFNCSTPIVESGSVRGSEPHTVICGAIGGQKKVGVLYLEASGSVTTSRGAPPLMVFKALLQALIDCLNLPPTDSKSV